MTAATKAGAQAADDHARWVLIESGSNQEFIFRSPKRRYSVGASALLLEVAEWVRLAARQHDDAEIVVATSSKALLRVKTNDAGRAIIRDVSTRAVEAAPGLDLWGVVEPGGQENERLGVRLAKLHELHAAARYGRPTPHRRSLVLPFLQPCALTGLAASRLDHTGGEYEWVPFSAQASAIVDCARKRHRALSDQWPGHTLSALTDEVAEDGWVAIVHADGNKIGELMMSIETVDQMSRVSAGLEAATAAALSAAIAEVGGDSPVRPWILPLIVGGDDITVIVDGQQALRFTESYLRQFEGASAQQPALAELAARVTGHAWVTASAGVLACQTSTPFSLAYALTEQVIARAKTVRTHATGRSAFSFFCAADSVPSSVDSTDSINVGGVHLVDGRGHVYVVPGRDDAPRSDWADAHSSSTLLDAVDVSLSDEPPLSHSHLHEIRMQLGDGILTQSTLDRARAASAAAATFLDAHLVVELPGGAGSFTRLLDLYDAMLLARGKVEEDDPSDTEEGSSARSSGH